MLLLLLPSSLPPEGGRFGTTGVAVGAVLNEVFKPDGPASMVVDGRDVMGVGEEPILTPSGAVDPNTFSNALLGENLFASSSSRSFSCMK